MNLLDKQIDRIDNLQRSHKTIAFAYAVIKKYGDDQTGHNAALVTYYGFLSLFPLLIVLTSVLQIIVGNGAHASLVNTVNSYFPVLGKDLSSNLHSLHRNSAIGLTIGLLGMLYGARGIADILRFSVNQIWHVPLNKRPGFPQNLLNSLSIIGVGGFGLILSMVLNGYAAGLGRSGLVRAMTSLVGLVIAIVVIYIVIRLALSSNRVPSRVLFKSAIVTGVSIQVMESFGGFLITHELRNTSSIYGTFAIVLGLLFWIYLLAQVLLYSLQVGVVKHRKLWPRSINSANPTEADMRVAPTEKI